jgi:mono/diheme cytochrome c family protein
VGREIARTICAACHVVAKGQTVSPNSEAPPFPMLAATPGMTTIALTAALLTSHRQMSNIVLQPDERRDVIA